MTTYAVRRRVACYVTRRTEQETQLLVFDHRDDDPDNPSGTQVPAGGMLPFEALVDAAVRETQEETGLAEAAFVRQVGYIEAGLDEPGGPAMTTFVHLTAPADGPERWEHTVSGDGEDVGMVFACRWASLPLDFELAGDQGRFLSAVPIDHR
jgi:8-oxo-dGTP pyrophosphatase MutT (NUDIX family)